MNQLQHFVCLTTEFHQRFPVKNRRKDFFLQMHGTQQFTAYFDKQRNMAVEANLANRGHGNRGM